MNQPGEFTTKASLYHYRWDYAPAAIAAICAALGGCQDKTLADIGAGNGMLGKHFLAREACVYLVEPNHAMLAVGQTELATYPAAQFVCAQAEMTTLPAQAVDAIVVGRALHWFEPTRARAEMQRILKPNGLLAILSLRAADQEIRSLLTSLRSAENGWNMRYGGGRPPDPPHERYFGHTQYQQLQFAQSVSESWEQFWGNLCSRSVAPNTDAPELEHFRSTAYQLFMQLSQNGVFTTQINTIVSLGAMQHA